MLSVKDNEKLTKVGPGTPMGELMRRYWQPVLLSWEVDERDGAPVRVRILGEDLVAFRDTSGRVGLLSEWCPHRLTSAADLPIGCLTMRRGTFPIVPSPSKRRHSISPLGGAGMLTCYPSATPFGLTLGAD